MRHVMNRFRPAALALACTSALAGPAAAAPVCAGKDLLADLKTTDPARHAVVTAAAETVENGKAVLWKIEGPKGKAPSWLFGTMHVSDPRVLDLPAEADEALKAARVVALENTNVLDPAVARAAYAEGLRFIVYSDGRTLPKVLDPEVWTKLKVAMDARGIPGWAVMGWKPWMVVFGVLLYPPCEIRRWTAGEKFLDIMIGERAKAAGKPVVDLETVLDQFSAIDAMTEADQIALLSAMLRIEDSIVDFQETTIRNYEAGRIDLLWATNIVLIGAADVTGQQAYITSLLENAAYRRNAVMLKNARPLIDEGNAFLAIGALHLVGDKGLVRLLREAGYTVTPVR